jgi:hypothetical protein
VHVQIFDVWSGTISQYSTLAKRKMTLPCGNEISAGKMPKDKFYFDLPV